MLLGTQHDYTLIKGYRKCLYVTENLKSLVAHRLYLPAVQSYSFQSLFSFSIEDVTNGLRTMSNKRCNPRVKMDIISVAHTITVQLLTATENACMLLKTEDLFIKCQCSHTCMRSTKRELSSRTHIFNKCHTLTNSAVYDISHHHIFVLTHSFGVKN